MIASMRKILEKPRVYWFANTTWVEECHLRAEGGTRVSLSKMSKIRDYQPNFDSKWIVSLAAGRLRRYIDAIFEDRRER
jgi:hypothetical protein